MYSIVLLSGTLIEFSLFLNVGKQPDALPYKDYLDLKLIFWAALYSVIILPLSWVYSSNKIAEEKTKWMWRVSGVLILLAAGLGVGVYQGFAHQGTGLAVLAIILLMVIFCLILLLATLLLSKMARLSDSQQIKILLTTLILLFLLNTIFIVDNYTL